MKTVLVMTLTAFSVLISSAAAQTPPPAKPEPICAATDPRELFACSVQGSMLMCVLQAQLALQDNDWAKVGQCKQKHQPAVREAYNKASVALKNKAAAIKEAKEAYASWIAAVEGLQPKAGERKIDYGQRIGALDDSLNQRVVRFKIESGLE